jgi:hypothetical protein
MSPLSSNLGRVGAFWLGDQGLSAFLGLLFLAIFLGPFTGSGLVHLLTPLFLSLLMVAGVSSVSRRTVMRVVAGGVACSAIVLNWMAHLVPSPAVQASSSLASLIFMVLLTTGVLYKVFRDDKPVTLHRVRGAIAAYLLFGITWSILYSLLDQTLPHAFSLPESRGLDSPGRQESITYFSFVTLATLGYGEITPTHGVSRMFAVLEALTGQLYPATLLARLVSLEVVHRTGSAAGK